MSVSHDAQAFHDKDTQMKVQRKSSAQILCFFFFFLASHDPSPAARAILSYWPQAD